MEKIKLFLLATLAIVLFTRCEKDEPKFFLPDLEYSLLNENLTPKKDRLVKVSSGKTTTLFLVIDGMKYTQTIKLYQRNITLKETVLSQQHIHNLTRKNDTIPISFRDLGKGNYNSQIIGISSGIDEMMLTTFAVEIEGSGNQTDPDPEEYGIICYLGDNIAGSTVYLNSNQGNMYLKVRGDFPNYTLVKYLWEDEVNAQSTAMYGKQANITLPYIPNSTRYVRVWIDGYKIQKFKVVGQ
ncbi:MAG: hypothetical protein PHU61_02515 [Candidatus Absconditabacteria bacterium]|nr:hypothetical protein [Candidatus Absconditabacteria bacterium]MDD3868153.1 hypothetical protein [Candidatus Absconditabacteria bacterium]MDD4714539.1 hypothetical protein [Candidatus Absconditabacteria bacterium]